MTQGEEFPAYQTHNLSICCGNVIVRVSRLEGAMTCLCLIDVP